MRSSLTSALAVCALVRIAAAATIPVVPGESIQAAIDAAAPGDVVEVAAGEYTETIDFGGRAITVRGTGPATVLRGAVFGAPFGPVVRFTTAEPPASVLSDLTITGGAAISGGGILVDGASPTILRVVLTGNVAGEGGSGIQLENSNALVANVLVTHNRALGFGDPHGIEIRGGAPVIRNNTVAFGDSNGLIVGGGSQAVIVNNMFVRNGGYDREFREPKGRGVCDFSGDRALIQYNLFSRNRIAALLTLDGTDYRLIRHAELASASPTLLGNFDANPGWRAAHRGDFTLGTRSRARDAGNPDPAWNDPDGTRSDVGYTGGPFAAR